MNSPKQRNVATVCCLRSDRSSQAAQTGRATEPDCSISSRSKRPESAPSDPAVRYIHRVDTLVNVLQLRPYIQGGPKNGTVFWYALTSSNINRFQNYFTVRIRRKCIIILSLKIPPHLKCVATLPCEMSSVFKENKEVCIFDPKHDYGSPIQTPITHNVRGIFS